MPDESSSVLPCDPNVVIPDESKRLKIWIQGFKNILFSHKQHGICMHVFPTDFHYYAGI